MADLAEHAGPGRLTGWAPAARAAGHSWRPAVRLALAAWLLLWGAAAAAQSPTAQPPATGAPADSAARAAAAQPTAPVELDTLLATIARQTTPRARFYERKHIALLDTPVDSTGELLFIAPARLEKHTRSPQAESMVIDGDTLTLERAGARRTMSLQQLPEAAPLVDSLRATLAGDRRTLERSFRIRLAGTPQRWTMTLVPLAPRAQRLVREVRLSGQQGWVNLVEIDQADGDSSVMRVQPLP